jgi:signal transduction histidine kinase
VAVARPIADLETTLDAAAWSLGLGALLASGVAVGLALMLTRRGLRPLRRMQATAESVAESEDLSVRLDEGRRDEVGALARSVNTMLERLELAQGRLSGALDEQRRFAADASHELRTPLTALAGDIELLRRHRLPEAEREQVLAEMSAAADRMRHLVEGLLALARTEGAGGAGVKAVDLAVVVGETVRPGELDSVLPEPGAAVVAADPDAARALVGNLVDNARRHGGGPRVGLSVEGGQAVLRVGDGGPGIAPAHRARVFDRFYRAPQMRSTPGAGLGLAIARQAAEGAGGSLRLLDAPVGALFEARLPLAPAGVSRDPARAGVPAA